MTDINATIEDAQPINATIEDAQTISVSLDGSGVTTFLGLTDSPTSYSGKASNYVKVNAGETARSEERRVGKECRSRWSPDHEKKKQ